MTFDAAGEPVSGRTGSGRRSRRTARHLTIGLAAAALFASVAGPASVSAAADGGTPYLPYDISYPAGTGKMVFAHYFPPLPISLDNQDPASDYYATQYLTPNGENGKHADYEGYLRDRPTPRAPLAASDWKVRDLKTEMVAAQSAGIDGFSVDIIQPRSATGDPQTPVVGNMLKAAEQLGTGFRVMLVPDMTGPMYGLSQTQLVDELAEYAKSPSAYRLSDGRLVVSPFGAERQDPAWWSQVIALFQSRHNITVAFVPMLINPVPNIDRFAPISYGLTSWGSRSPSGTPTEDLGSTTPVGIIKRVHDQGKIWMQPVAVQDIRPDEGLFDESQNSTNYRMNWQIAREQKAEWVQVVTWNDYSESTQIAPSQKGGRALLDMTALEVAAYKHDITSVPAAQRDVVYLSHRAHPLNATSLWQQSHTVKPVAVRPGSSPARDSIEALVYATAPGSVTVRAGSTSTTCQVPAGRSVCELPVALGQVSATVTRNNATVASLTSPLTITNRPAVRDFAYHFFTSGR